MAIDYYNWNTPTRTESKALAKICIPYLKYLAPEIIQNIVDQNSQEQSYFEKLLSVFDVDPSIYLWSKSTCLFPGVRRHAGKEENRAFLFSEGTRYKDSLMIDSNTFPKHIWTFLFTGKKFSTVGPAAFSLAHLVDHKTYAKKRLTQKFGSQATAVLENHHHPFSGLFTAATNTIFVSETLLKPTDNNDYIRDLLIFHASKIYGECAQLFPFDLQYQFSEEIQSDYEEYCWPDPVGNLSKIELFYEYRKATYAEIESNLTSRST